MDPTVLPVINASLNGLATIFLIAGRVLIKRGQRDQHRRVMSVAFGISSLFLLGYVIHKLALGFDSVQFNVVGPAKTAYLVMLFTHITLATTVPVLAITLIYLGLSGRFERHARLARWAWPIWMYVSVTGVIIYVLLYQVNPAAP